MFNMMPGRATMSRMMIAVVVFACVGQTHASCKEPTNDLATGQREFAADLYARLASMKEGNIFFSPTSIRTALGMTYVGAAGNTAEEMAKTLRFSMAPDELAGPFGELIKRINSPVMLQKSEWIDDMMKTSTVPAYELHIANALWMQQGYQFKKEFLEQVQTHFQARASDLDFAQSEQARQVINKWVEQKTSNRITDLIGPGVLDALTRLVLTNAIYFKSDWAYQFQKANTRTEKFHTSPDDSVDVEMMNQTHQFRYMEDPDVQVVELPYVGDELAMMVILPKRDLADAEAKLSPSRLDEWSNSLAFRAVRLGLPKFTFTSEFELNEALKAMGMPEAFSYNADFTGMTERRDLYISAVIHKAFVEVDEAGTEAAAATAVVMRTTSVPMYNDLVEFFVDRPFIFLIRHNETGEILFMGRVKDPRG